MKKIDEIKARTSLAADFLCSMWDGQSFASGYVGGIKGEPSPFVHKLSAMLSLQRAAIFLDSSNLKRKADEVYASLQSHTFEQDNLSFLVNDDVSRTPWNAIMSLFLTCRGDFDQSERFLNSVRKTEVDNGFSRFFPSNDVLGVSGIPLLALIEFADKAEVRELFDEAVYMADLIVVQPPVFDCDEVEAMMLLFHHAKEEKFLTRAQNILNHFKKVEMNVATCLYASMSLNSSASVGDKDFADEAYKRICDLQLDNNANYPLQCNQIGAFVRNEISDEIRIDYMTNSINGLIRYARYADF